MQFSVLLNNPCRASRHGCTGRDEENLKDSLIPSQERLAELADLAPRTIQKIEAGHITILVTTLRRLRKAIGCSCDALMREDFCRK